ncbi:membrane protein [Nonlabens sp. YIK11]|uniref:YfhO family protein n=1 Tax=Nonlabens sp. YIK11 TaxID=1453349 RepID=UPI0006DC5043|nr:YfhO family protein [Nonlabens sp. YIK11]KQC33702.1 membrane protein [Nonlabens sp. YIK11]
MQFQFKKIIPHLAVFVIFIIASLAYFYPVLSGKKLYQNDIVQYKGNARQLIENREVNGEEIYWTDSVFGGMPTYQLGARYDYDFIDSLDRAIRFLPRPADYLFLYFICFYILMMVLRVDWRLGLLGALAFGFSTYLVIILGVGHNAKAHAIAYFPLVLSGIILVFQRRYIWGGILTAIAMALELQANHPQMTYYLLMAVAVLGTAYLIDTIRRNILPHYFKSIGIMIAAVLLALGTNASNLLATKEYSQESTRGPSELTINAQGESVTTTNGLDYDYITQYSYGIAESLNLIIPRFAGGGSGERPDEESNTVDFLVTTYGIPKADALAFAQQNVPLYWGAQPIVEAPAYIGITVFFLALLACFLIKGRLKWWTIGAAVLALLLSYGKNLDFLTSFFVEYVPLYSKFRAITSIQVIIELCIPILAVVGLYQLFNKKHSLENKWKALKYAGLGLGGVILFIALLGNQFFDFAGPYDASYRNSEQLGQGFVDALRQDRFEMMRADAFRSLLYVGLIVAGLFLYLKSKLSENLLILGLGILILIDLVGFDQNYINYEETPTERSNFVRASDYDPPFEATQADLEIAKDDEVFRVYDLLQDPFNSGRSPYFHRSLGGYHGAKPKRISDLADFYLRDENGYLIPEVTSQNREILNMFNVKYIITANENQIQIQENEERLGPAWFVKEYATVKDANEEIQSLIYLNRDSVAIIQEDQKKLLNLGELDFGFNGSIELIDYSPEKLTYKSKSSQPELAVFSEAYYPHGWKATIDGKEVPIAKVNYALRGLSVPAGDHEIVFEFDPEVVKTGNTVMLASNVLLGLVILGSIFLWIRKSR